MTKGKLVVLDGLDGSGKSTQLDLAADYLRKLGVSFRAVSFPNYDTLSGQLVRQYLDGTIKCEGKNGAYSASTIYAVDRYVSYSTDWKEFYQSGGLIITGRYTTSNAIYQLTKMPKEEYVGFLNWLYNFEYNKLGLPEPDKVIFLDMPIEVSQELLKKRYEGDESKKDIHERNVDFLRQCRESAMFAAENGGWSMIECAENGNPLSVEEIHEQICRQLDSVIR
ncbi:MAG: thymidylate kinase [Oscillospiraceae bacterium]|nr:thymidylate kinase [Oscillospiraceae bacterium]